MSCCVLSPSPNSLAMQEIVECYRDACLMNGALLCEKSGLPSQENQPSNKNLRGSAWVQAGRKPCKLDTVKLPQLDSHPHPPPLLLSLVTPARAVLAVTSAAAVAAWRARCQLSASQREKKGKNRDAPERQKASGDTQTGQCVPGHLLPGAFAPSSAKPPASGQAASACLP